MYSAPVNEPSEADWTVITWVPAKEMCRVVLGRKLLPEMIMVVPWFRLWAFNVIDAGIVTVKVACADCEPSEASTV